MRSISAGWHLLSLCAAALLGCASGPSTGPNGTAATQLVFTVSPGLSFSGTRMRAVKVSAEDANGQVATDFTGVISIDLAPHAAGKSLRGTTIIAAVGGVATFTDLEIDGAAPGNLLIASTQGLTPATSTAFASHLTRLVFAVQPDDPIAGTPIAPSVQVAAVDSAGHILTGFTGQVKISDEDGGHFSGLTGTLTATAVAGVAAFPNIIIGHTGSGWQLIANAPGFVLAYSAPFASHPPRLAFTVQPSVGQAGKLLAPPIQVTFQDDSGHTLTGFTRGITIALVDNPSGGHLTGVTTEAAVGGVATFADLAIDVVGAGYRLIASSVARAVGDTSAAFDVIPCSQTCWTVKAPIPIARYDLGVGVVQNVLYAVGGATEPYGEGIVASVDAYDPATDSWTTRAPMPTARTGVGVGVVDGVLYAVGGSSATALSGVAEAYDPATDTWTTKAPMPTPRYGLGVAVVDGVLYAVGGSDNSGLSTVAEAYDPATDSWTAKASMPTPRSRLGVGVLNGVLYAVGGYTGAGYSGAVEAYDPATNRWTAKGSMPNPTIELGVGVLNGVLYQVGLTDYRNGALEADAYDPVVNRWTALATSPLVGGLARWGVGVVNGVLYVPGRPATLAFQP